MLSGDSSQQHGTATLLTHRQPRQLRTPQPAQRRREGDNLHRAQFGSIGAKLSETTEGGTEPGGGSGRGSSPVPSPPWRPQSCGNIPAVAPPPPLLPPARSPALPSQPPPQALKDTAARWPATPGRPRVEGSRRAPRPARGSPRRPALPGAALAHRPVLLVRPVAADAQPGKAAGSQRSAAAGAPAAAPGAEQQQERSTCGGRHLSTGNGAGPGSAADGRGVAKTRHSVAPGQLQP